jgi:hypothetical protein
MFLLLFLHFFENRAENSEQKETLTVKFPSIFSAFFIFEKGKIQKTLTL